MWCVVLLVSSLLCGRAEAGAQATYIEINNFSGDDVKLSVTNVDNHDWEHNRPDHNLQGRIVKKNSHIREQLDRNDKEERNMYELDIAGERSSVYCRINQNWVNGPDGVRDVCTNHGKTVTAYVRNSTLLLEVEEQN